MKHILKLEGPLNIKIGAYNRMSEMILDNPLFPETFAPLIEEARKKCIVEATSQDKGRAA